MKQEDRQKLFDKLMEGAAEQSEGNTTALKLFAQSTTEDLDKIEPLIDEMVKDAISLHWSEKDQTWMLPGILISFHEAVQLLTFLKFHEWHEPRPGYHECPECKIEFSATPESFRRHRDRCRVGELIKILQAKITMYEGSKNHAIPDHAPST